MWHIPSSSVRARTTPPPAFSGLIIFFVVALVVVIGCVWALRLPSGNKTSGPDSLVWIRIAADNGSMKTANRVNARSLSEARRRLASAVRAGDRGYIRQDAARGQWIVYHGPDATVTIANEDEGETVFIFAGGAPHIRRAPAVATKATTVTPIPPPAATSIPLPREGFRAHPGSTVDAAAVLDGAAIRRFATFEDAVASSPDSGTQQRPLIVAGGPNDPTFYAVYTAPERTFASAIVSGGAGSIVYEPINATTTN